MYELSPKKLTKNDDVGRARDEPQHPVPDAVEPVDLPGDEEPAHQPRHGGDVQQARGGSRRTARPQRARAARGRTRRASPRAARARRCRRRRRSSAAPRRTAVGHGRREHQQVEQLQAAVEEPPDAAAAGRGDAAEVGVGGPCRRAVPVLPCRDRLPACAATRRARAGRRRPSTSPTSARRPRATTASAPIVIGAGADHPAVGVVAAERRATRITVCDPIRSMSVHTGTVGEKIVTPLPIFAPSARRYIR